MSRKVIDIGSKTTNKVGAFGSYFKLPKGQGVKVLGLSGRWDGGDHGVTSIVKLKLSSFWKDAKKEADLLIQAHGRATFVPECSGPVVVRIKGKYYAGILMEHIAGRQLDMVSQKDLKGFENKQPYGLMYSVIDKIRRALESHGIDHRDLHGGNVMVAGKKNSRRFVVLDFSPSFVTIKKKPKQ